MGTLRTALNAIRDGGTSESAGGEEEGADEGDEDHVETTEGELKGDWT